MAAPTEPEAIPADVLEPCPFCGGEAKIIEGEECAYVQCADVKMHRALWFDGDNNAAGEVAEQWNRRASRAPVDGAGWMPLPAAPGTHPAPEAHGWKCNCCGTVFTSSQRTRSGGAFDAGAACPRCKAGGQYTYPYPLHLGDPCATCGTAHDDVPAGPCAPASPDAEMVRLTASRTKLIDEVQELCRLIDKHASGKARRAIYAALSKHEGHRS